MSEEWEPEEPEDRQQEVVRAVAKFVGIALALGLAIGLGTMFVVKSLDLNSDDSGPVGGQYSATPIQPLPTAALTSPGESEPTGDGETDLPTDLSTVTFTPGQDGLQLSSSPEVVGPMERINLTGQWPGQDNVSLMVQRFEDGEWVDFGVQVQVRVGSFATYVLTGREGENKFRVYDPSTDTASNEVSIDVQQDADRGPAGSISSGSSRTCPGSARDARPPHGRAP